MSYLVLARKYRPGDFSQISGQEHVTRTLSNSIRRDKIPHAILLSGPRGVGKTSIARIFSKALNCEKGPTPNPCLTCSNCIEIAQGTSLAVREIDGASHNSVDNVRELIDSFRSLPAPGNRYKVYIIDEVHMLSLAAFNALLKSLEEPPPHTVFILATTESHRIPDTVISRCQRHDLRALSAQEIEAQLAYVFKKEKIKAEPEVLRMIARLADGSMRDAQSLLDRIQSFCDGAITAEDTSRVLGMVERRVLFSLSGAVIRKDAQQVLTILLESFSTGLDIAIFLREFVAHWRELLLAKYLNIEALRAIGVAEDDVIEMQRQVKGISDALLQALVQQARVGADMALRSAHPKYALEALLVQMACLDGSQQSVAMESPSQTGAARRSAPPTESSKSVPIQGRNVQGESQSNIQSANSQRSPSKTGTQLDWWGFVKQLSTGKSKMLAEHLKRLSVRRFTLGELEAVGPEFTARSLQKGDYYEKFLAVLKETYQHSDWKLTIEVAESGMDEIVQSVAEQEKRESEKSTAQKKQSLLEHPQLKQLQKAFPGSAIEDIKLR